jgi:ssDNA-binding replication factor A large subunit
VTEVENEQRREAFARRRASVDPWADPEIVDPRETLEREQLAGVNSEAARLHGRYGEVSRAAIGRELGERVAEGQSLVSAVVAVAERLRERPGRIVPLAELETVDAGEVCVEGVIERLWTPSHPSIQWVGLLEDETGRVKVTSWKRSNQPTVRAGERVRIRAAAKNWYEGRVSLAVTGWSSVTFPERGRYWV